MRLTKDVRRQLLEQNEGFSTKTSYEGKNFSEDRKYTIKDGELHVQASGNTSWADSRFNNEFIADDEQTHRFLYNYLNQLNKDGVDESETSRSTPRAKPGAASSREVESPTSEDYDGDSDDSSEVPNSAIEKSTLIVLVVIAVAAVVGAIAFFVARPLWRNRIKPYLAQKRAIRAQRKAEKARQKELED